MIKSILLFMKAHAVATTITATVVVGTAVTAPIVVSDYLLDKNVKENLSMLVSSNYQATNDNQTENNNQIQNEDKPTANENKPLTFKIEKVVHKTEGGNIVKDMQGNDAYEMSSEGIEYKIVPSYDKDYSKWTKDEKKAYQKAYEEAAKMAEEAYQSAMANESTTMADAMLAMAEIENSFSKEYIFNCGNSDGSLTPEFWQYNSYTKLYTSGTATKDYGEEIEKTVQVRGVQSGMKGVIPEDFKNIVYPLLKQKIEDNVELRVQIQIREEPTLAESPNAINELKAGFEPQKQKALKDLEELYHLSD